MASNSIFKPVAATPRLPGQPWSMRDAAAFLTISVDTLERAVAAGQVKRISLGSRRVAIPDAEVQRVATEGFNVAKELS